MTCKHCGSDLVDSYGCGNLQCPSKVKSPASDDVVSCRNLAAWIMLGPKKEQDEREWIATLIRGNREAVIDACIAALRSSQEGCMCHEKNASNLKQLKTRLLA